MLCFPLLLLKSSGLFCNLMLPWTYNGKIEKMAFIVKPSLYFDNPFIEMILEWSSTRQMILPPSSDFVALATKMQKKKEYV